MMRRERALVTVALALLSAGLAGQTQARTAAKPNLVVSAVRASVGSAVAGSAVTIADTTTNAGKGRAGKSQTAFFLSADARKDAADARLGSRAVPALAARKKSSKQTKLTIPASARAGEYRVLACADAGAKLREKSERDNCKAAAAALAITAPSVTQPTESPTPGSATTPSGSGDGSSSTGTTTTPPADPSTQLQAVRDAPDGAANLPVAGVVVTYVKPAVGSDLAGFFVQAAQTGPALFVAVDPSTLSPSPVVGDRVGFTVASIGTNAGVRTALAISNFSRTATAVDVGSLEQSVGATTDLVSSLGSYESELIGFGATIASAFGAAGAGHESAAIDTAGIAGNANLRLRLPTTLRDSLDLAAGCAFTLNRGPMWRFNDQAQPSAYSASDLSVSTCPAPQVVSVNAPTSTSVTVHFDRLIEPSSVASDGSQFTADNGLTFSAASVSGRTVTLTSSTQSNATYTVSVAASVTDTLGTGVDQAANGGQFSGFEPVAVLRLNEIAPNVTSARDLIELEVVSGGSVEGITITQAATSTETLVTFPHISVATGDLIVVHQNPDLTEITETTSKTEGTATTFYAGAWDVDGNAQGVTFGWRVITVRDPANAIQDAVPFVNTNTTMASGFPTQLQATQGAGAWLPSSCGGSPCDETTTPKGSEVSVLWNTVGTSATGNTVARTSGSPDTNQKADWAVGTQTLGSNN